LREQITPLLEEISVVIDVDQLCTNLVTAIKNDVQRRVICRIMKESDFRRPIEFRLLVDAWPASVDAEDFPVWDNFCHPTEEVVIWLDENMGAGQWTCDGTYCVFCFRRESDAILFKLRWDEGR
jgi:hypothetical protein